MLNQLLKFGLFLSAGLWIKRRARGLLILLAVLTVTWILHREYLSYLQQSGSVAYLELSYVLKLTVFLVSCGAYYYFVERVVRKEPSSRNTIHYPSDHSNQGDGFDFIRQKKTLETELDKELKKTKNVKQHLP